MQHTISKTKPKLTDGERHKRFVETAKKVDASENKSAFDKAFDKVLSQPNTKGKPTRPE